MIINGGTINGGTIFDKSQGLYTFDTFTFTNANVWGRTGPTLSQTQTAYGNATFTWLNNPNYFTVSGGIQTWTVPKTGTYRITAYGAQGSPATASSGGVGAVIQGDFSLTEGEKIDILVGQSANVAAARIYKSSPGGGGTFVIKDTVGTPTTSDILVIAGGGGGTGSEFQANANANVTTSGTRAGPSFSFGSGGTNGGGGTAGDSSSGAGAGFTGNGAGGGGGIRYTSGGLGGIVSATYAPGGGGFGGGASVVNGLLFRYGGGGGYSGGGGSGTSGNTDGSGITTGNYGGGGGSYNNGTNQVNRTGAQGNFGNGKVIVTFIG